MKIRNKSGSLYSKLLCSYVLFSLLVVLLFSGSLLIVSVLVSKGSFTGLTPYLITDGESCEKGLPGIMNMDGWIEILDTDYRVTQVLGEKKTSAQSYKPEELFPLLSPGGEPDQKYIGFLNEKTDGRGYYLVILGRTEIRLTTTVLYGPENSNPAWSKLFLAVFFSLFTLMCALMALFLNRRIKRPLKLLSEGMKQVRQGERGVQLSFRAEAEFAEIRDTFNVMSSTLEAAVREKADAEQKKNKMLLELSHDIRTPLSTIRSYAIALEQDVVRGEDLAGYYGVIRRKAERVNLLADELFTMLKMQSSEYELSKTTQDICEFLRRECAEYYEEAQENGLEMTVEISDETICLDADYTLLKRVMGNLLSNAVKHNRTGREIAVALRTDSRMRIEIEVSDDGAPIPENLRKQMFDDFVRGDSSRKTDGGTGLGLAIARAIAKKHGGTVDYRYDSGKNRFTVALPASCREEINTQRRRL